MSALVFALPGNEELARNLAHELAGDSGLLEAHAFPDGETYLRFADDPAGRAVVLVCTLDRPDAKIPALLFAAEAARELGATQVGLVAPYLCYMRQDSRFQPGEAVTSRSFARLVSQRFDWLVTIDPHLHRIRALDEIYSIPAVAISAAPAIAAWIGDNVRRPFLIGPDSESRQWVEAVAGGCGAPWTVMEKVRLADRAVRETVTAPPLLSGRTPVILDDIVSSGITLMEAGRLLPRGTARHAIAIHALCDRHVVDDLAKAGICLAATNTVAHPAAQIDVTPLLAQALRTLL